MVMLVTPLSPRELEVCRYVVLGASNRKIAAAMFLSENTVEFHMRNIFQKLHLTSRTQVALYYFQNKATIDACAPIAV
jgi:DNA-binding NarL/FixJ family response regulator